MPLHGPSVATFLMQAEENLAALGAQLESPEQTRPLTPRSAALVVHQGPAGPAKTAPQHGRSAEARASQQADKPERTRETLRSFEEQLDIQARSLLGIDKRLRGLEGRLRQSVEATIQELLHGPLREIDKRVSELQAASVQQADKAEAIGRREFQVLERKVAEVLLANKRSASAAGRAAPNALVERRLSEIEAALQDVGETLDSGRSAPVEQRLLDLEVQQQSFFTRDASSEDEVRIWMRGVDTKLAQLEPARDQRADPVERWEVGAMEERAAIEQAQAISEIVSLQERFAELELSVSRLTVRGPAAGASMGMQDPAATRSLVRPRVSSESLASAEASASVPMNRNVEENGASAKTRSISASSITSGGLCGLSATMRGLGEACGATEASPGIVRMQVHRLNSQGSLASPAPFDKAGLADVELSSHEKRAVATAHASLNRLTSLLEVDKSVGVRSEEALQLSSFEPATSPNDRIDPLDSSEGDPDYPVSRDLPLASPRHSPFQGYNDRTSLNTITEAPVAPSGDFAIRSEPQKDSVGRPWGIDSEGDFAIRSEPQKDSVHRLWGIDGEGSSGARAYVMPPVSSAGSPTVPGSTTAASTPPACPSLSASLSALRPAAEPPIVDPLAEVDQGLDPTDLLDVFLVELSGQMPGADKSLEVSPQPAAPSTAGLADICARLRATPPVTDVGAAANVPLVQTGSVFSGGSSTSSSPTGSLSSLPM